MICDLIVLIAQNITETDENQKHKKLCAKDVCSTKNPSILPLVTFVLLKSKTDRLVLTIYIASPAGFSARAHHPGRVHLTLASQSIGLTLLIISILVVTSYRIQSDTVKFLLSHHSFFKYTPVHLWKISFIYQ